MVILNFVLFVLMREARRARVIGRGGGREGKGGGLGREGRDGGWVRSGVFWGGVLLRNGEC